MQFSASIFASLAFIFLAASGVFAQNSHTPLRRGHLNRLPSFGARGQENDLAVRGPGTLQRRFDQARFSYYDVGLGACGKTNVASDFVSYSFTVRHHRHYSNNFVPTGVDCRFKLGCKDQQRHTVENALMDCPQQFGSGGYCFQIITITYGGKSTQAQIADEVGLTLPTWRNVEVLIGAVLFPM